MKRNNIEIGDYHAALILHQTGSFRAAADAVHLSPSALSRQITRLEDKLGVRLFDRDTRNVRTTSSGRAFAEVAERMLNVAEDGLSEFQAHIAARNGRLTIAGLPSVTAGLLPAVLEHYTKQNPNVDVHIMDALSEAVLRAVEMGEADIGFTAGTVDVRGRLSFQRLLDDEFVAVGTADGPLAENRPYCWDELLEMPFIAMAQGTSVRELMDGACSRAGRKLEPRFEVSHLATAGALIAQGLGISALPTLTLPVLGSEHLVFRSIPDFGAKRCIGLVWRTGRTLSPTAQVFLKLARSWEHEPISLQR